MFTLAIVFFFSYLTVTQAQNAAGCEIAAMNKCKADNNLKTAEINQLDKKQCCRLAKYVTCLVNEAPKDEANKCDAIGTEAKRVGAAQNLCEKSKHVWGGKDDCSGSSIVGISQALVGLAVIVGFIAVGLQ